MARDDLGPARDGQVGGALGRRPGLPPGLRRDDDAKCLIHGAAAAPPPPPPRPRRHPRKTARASCAGIAQIAGRVLGRATAACARDAVRRRDVPRLLGAAAAAADVALRHVREREWPRRGGDRRCRRRAVRRPEERPMRRAASLDAATVLASRLDNNRNKPDVAASVLGPLAVAVPEARSRRPSDDTPPSTNEDSDEDVATLRKRRSPSSSPRAVTPSRPRRRRASSRRAPTRSPSTRSPTTTTTRPRRPRTRTRRLPWTRRTRRTSPSTSTRRRRRGGGARRPGGRRGSRREATFAAGAAPHRGRGRRRGRRRGRAGGGRAGAAAEAEEAALLARLARCGADLGKAASEGDPAAAMKALNQLDALGDVENSITSYEGLGATGVIQAEAAQEAEDLRPADARR